VSFGGDLDRPERPVEAFKVGDCFPGIVFVVVVAAAAVAEEVDKQARYSQVEQKQEGIVAVAGIAAGNPPRPGVVHSIHKCYCR